MGFLMWLMAQNIATCKWTGCWIPAELTAVINKAKCVDQVLTMHQNLCLLLHIYILMWPKCQLTGSLSILPSVLSIGMQWVWYWNSGGFALRLVTAMLVMRRVIIFLAPRPTVTSYWSPANFLWQKWILLWLALLQGRRVRTWWPRQEELFLQVLRVMICCWSSAYQDNLQPGF